MLVSEKWYCLTAVYKEARTTKHIPNQTHDDLALKMQFCAGIAVALLVLTCHASANADDRICPDNENPLNFREYKLPNERTDRGWLGNYGSKKAEDMRSMFLKWIPRDSVSCAVNQLSQDEQLSKLIFIENETYRTINVGAGCQYYIRQWLFKMQTILLHDVLVVLRAKSITFFNEYFDLKQYAFGDKLISDLDSELVDRLDQLRRELKDGFILPQNAKQPTYENFNQALWNSVQIYRDIRSISWRNRSVVKECKYAVILDREESRQECFRLVLDHVVGRSKPSASEAFGYGDYIEVFDRSIRHIGEYFGQNIMYASSLPNVPPCFRD